MSKPNRSRRRLPAIREESPFKTNRIPVHIIPPGASLQRIQGGSMLIQNLPDEPSKPPPKVTPSNRYHDSVDQIVSDYLHFSKYGEVIPVSNGFAPNVCPCCMDRNRENVQMLKQRNRAPPEEPDPKISERSVPERGNGDRRWRATNRHFPSSWMDYQPLPHTRTYLNAEFNRVSMVQSYEEDRKQYENANMEYVSGRVLDANTKYDLAMLKLQRSLRNFSEDDDERLYE
ncbi:uncharacterized protein [Littorina saxatilis]|uniref:uncharacterized protein isoform X2 n=1 Tax=Littorina saxatilis TaxID=31220 RepID=UPI0038B61C27